jgi:hypothetical protein
MSSAISLIEGRIGDIPFLSAVFEAAPIKGETGWIFNVCFNHPDIDHRNSQNVLYSGLRSEEEAVAMQDAFLTKLGATILPEV